MADLDLAFLEKYDFNVDKSIKARGAILLETDKGLKRLLEYNGTQGKMQFLSILYQRMAERGFNEVDFINKNLEGEYITINEEGNKYIVTDWFLGSECDVKSKGNVKDAVIKLASLHNVLGGVAKGLERDCLEENLIEVYLRHNNELKRAYRYIRGRKHKSVFEYNVLGSIERYMEASYNASERLNKSGYMELVTNKIKEGDICHGNYNYHNVIFTKNGIAIVNFERCEYGILIQDFYLFFRKVMEKYDWDEGMGKSLIEEYDKFRPIPNEEYEILKIMLSYPEKFWKLVNQYMNSNKSLMPDKNLVKLNTVCRQQDRKEKFVRAM